MQHRGRGIALTGGDELRALAPDRCFYLRRVEHRAPFGLDGDDLGTGPPRDFGEEMPEATEDQHQHLVTGRDQGRERRLDASPRGAVYDERPLVRRAEHLPVERHGLVHVLRELRVELALQRHRHGAQHTRIDVDGPRPHQQARLRIKFGEDRRCHDIARRCMGVRPMHLLQPGRGPRTGSDPGPVELSITCPSTSACAW